ncbi:MAG: HAMP domain-containing histidine kinase [Lachnospiraceae bacterium]|nr:HAMP domain-containing histidine kinase [Lachnospiraceae bacterium]
MRKFLFPAIVGALLLMFTDWYLIGSANHSYQEKIRILTVMIEEQQKGRDSLQAASELLKGAEDRQGKAGAEKLKAYGYLEGQENSFSLERKRTVRTIVMCSGFVYLLYLFSLYWLAEQWKKQRRQELEELSWVLEQFSGHVYETDFIERLSEKETELERIAGQLAALSEQLRYNEERLGKEKEETRSLVTDISHQLKTPVAGLKACFEILSQEDLTQAEEREFLQQCTRQLTGLEELVGALVNISRMETGMIQIRREPADILETLVSAVNRVLLKAEEKQIDIEFEKTEDLAEMIIPHDVKWLCEAFINILENAVKYSPQNTKIRIRMIRLITFLRIEIEDQGIGIPRDALHKIFQRFYRGEAEQVRQTEGSGVGLYLTREILERHGGNITVSSQYGEKRQGSVFVVQIPYAY